jgi:hypothetical protein
VDVYIPEPESSEVVSGLDPTWNATPSPFVKQPGGFTLKIGNKRHGSIVFPQILNSKNPIAIQIQKNTVQQILASGGTYKAELVGKYLVYRGENNSILYRYDADKQSLREFVYLKEASALAKSGDVIQTSIPGLFTVTYNVTDSSGNAAVQVTRTVNVVDTTLPVVTAPANVTAEATGANTTVAIGTATATDAVGIASITSNAPASFPVGLTVVTWTATDTVGNTGTATQNVTVHDTTAPAIALLGSSPVTVEFGSAYTDAGSTASDNVDGDVTASIVVGGLPINTSVLGTNTVTYNVTDASGNAAAQVTRTVNVVDTTLPVVTAPANVTAEATGTTTAVTIGTATATDNVAVASITNDAPAGGYPVGTTVVTWTATDTSGNTGTATQQVTVNAAPLVQLQTLRDFTNSLGLSNSLRNNLNRKLNRAESAIEDGNITRATNKLNAFINKVQDKTPQPISQSDANVMIQSAQSIIALL